MHDLKFHDAANIFPLMIGDDFKALVEDIRKNGLQQDIELLDGEIIDGRNRYKACKDAGVNPRLSMVKTDDPVAYVLSRNLHRRHLTVSQRAMVAARVREVYENAAKERKKAGQKHGGESAGRGRPKEPDSLVADLPPSYPTSRKARDEAGRSLNVGGRTVDSATAVIEKAVPELVKAVDEGRVTVSAAAKLLNEKPAIQQQAAAGELPKTKQPKSEPAQNDGPAKIKGIGVFKGNEAINVLKQIPRNDPLRNRGFQLVADWMRKNK